MYNIYQAFHFVSLKSHPVFVTFPTFYTSGTGKFIKYKVLPLPHEA